MRTILATILLGIAGYTVLVYAEKHERTECAADDFSDTCVGADSDNLGDWQEINYETKIPIRR